MENKTIVQFATDAMITYLKGRKRKITVNYDGIDLQITKHSTVFSIVREYKLNDKKRTEKLNKLFEDQIDRIQNLKLNFPI